MSQMFSHWVDLVLFLQVIKNGKMIFFQYILRQQTLCRVIELMQHTCYCKTTKIIKDHYKQCFLNLYFLSCRDLNEKVASGIMPFKY